MTDPSVPSPPADALAHSAALQARIAARIRAAGDAIDFSEYMRAALYEPGLGYYSAGSAKFGPAGDFITAPEISPLFGACIADQLAPLLRDWPDAQVLELGPGSGALAIAVLRRLAVLEALPARYLLLETSADLRARQQQALAAALPELSGRVHWLDAPPCDPWRGVVLANEVLDAQPVSRFIVTEAGWQALGTSLATGDFVDRPMPPTPALAADLARLAAALPAPLPVGYHSEFDPALGALLGTLATPLVAGWLIFIDYGHPRAAYYHPGRHRGTLMCHYRHRAYEDPYLWPGLQDITAWVDFTALAEAGHAADLELLGYATQANFLMAAGLEALAAEDATDEIAGYLQAQQLKRLLLPSEMGERFKVMALGRRAPPPAAFERIERIEPL